jgi:RNA polymerase sigma-70 factor (ECF subfamily)
MMNPTNSNTQTVDGRVQEPHLTDEQLLLRYRNTGDRQLFAQLVERYERQLYGYLRRYLGDAEMAEDVFQAAFLQVHLKCDQFEQGRKFRPWIYTIATNQAIDARRRNKRHRQVSLDRLGKSNQGEESGKLADLLVSGETDPLEQVEEMESGRQVQQALEQLPDHMRTVIHLVYYQGLKYREAAEILEVPVGTVKSRLHAAVQKLNEVWTNTHVQQK